MYYYYLFETDQYSMCLNFERIKFITVEWNILTMNNSDILLIPYLGKCSHKTSNIKLIFNSDVVLLLVFLHMCNWRSILYRLATKQAVTNRQTSRTTLWQQKRSMSWHVWQGMGHWRSNRFLLLKHDCIVTWRQNHLQKLTTICEICVQLTSTYT